MHLRTGNFQNTFLAASDFSLLQNESVDLKNSHMHSINFKSIILFLMSYKQNN